MPIQIPPTTPQPLHSILLIARTRSGPRLVAYYPPTPPRPHQSSSTPRYSSRSSSPSSSLSETDLTTSDDEQDYRRSSKKAPWSPNSHDDTNQRTQPTEGSTLDDLPPFAFGSGDRDRKAESLARLLAPNSRVWHKKRFEVAVEDFVFLGCPVFEQEGGGWGGRRRRKDAATVKAEERGEDEYGADEDDKGDPLGITIPSTIAATETDGQSSPEVHPNDFAAAGAARLISKLDQTPPLSAPDSSMPTSSMQSASTTGPSGGTAPESLGMFNLVFVLQPSQSQPASYQSTIQDIYTNVVKQLSKALAHQQKRHGFVWTETRLIASLLSGLGDSDGDKDRLNGHKHNQQSTVSRSSSPTHTTYTSQWSRVAAKSELARAMAATYDCISQGQIAHLTLGSGLSLALQIPQVQKTPFAPTPMAPDTNGALWLTTYDASASNDTNNGGKNNATNNNSNGDSADGARAAGGTGISPYSALLLLQDSETLAREIAAQPATGLTMPLAYYTRHSVPTKSLSQLARNLKLSLQEIQLLSLHLIHYRRAIAIPPLHVGHTYIVSPNADFRNLPQASAEFAKRFAMLPSLVAILSKLPAPRASSNQGPHPWGLMIPSSDHKAAYMEVLEWLMRGGWVTQLRTFCWVRVSAAVKASVARRMRREEREAAAAEALAAAVSEEELDGEDASDVGDRPRKPSDESADRTLAAFSPRLRAHLVPPRPPSEAGSTSTARTAVRVSNPKRASSRISAGYDGIAGQPSIASHEHRVSDGSTKAKPGLEASLEDEGPEIAASDFEPSIIASPHKADALESRWLEHIATTLSGDELRRAWPKLVKYFDGAHALEEIALREGWKRKFVAPLLLKLTREPGLLLTVRHW